MRVIAFVPIKFNSERLPGKNTSSFSNGRSLISSILDTLLRIDDIDETIVYCSNDTIREYLPIGVTFLQRPEHLDLPQTPFIEVLTSFAEVVDSDIYVLAHATAPFISAESIIKAIDAVKTGVYDSAFSVSRCYDFLWLDGKPLNYSLDKIPRTQDLEPIFKETCGLYVYTKALIKSSRRIGTNPFFVELSKIESCDINDEEDFIIADAISAFLDETRGSK